MCNQTGFYLFRVFLLGAQMEHHVFAFSSVLFCNLSMTWGIMALLVTVSMMKMMVWYFVTNSTHKNLWPCSVLSCLFQFDLKRHKLLFGPLCAFVESLFAITVTFIYDVYKFILWEFRQWFQWTFWILLVYFGKLQKAWLDLSCAHFRCVEMVYAVWPSILQNLRIQGSPKGRFE